MAVELCSEISGVAGMSPRISFSHDFCQTDGVHIEQRNLLSNSSSSGFESSLDFDFCVRESFDRESSSADELFSDGKILPIQIKKKGDPPKSKTDQPKPQPLLHPDHAIDEQNSKRGSGKEKSSAINESEEKQGSKSFWRFKRSSSLNCGSGYGRSLCSLPLLSRSNSTGSEPSVKKSQLHKDSDNYNHKHKSSPSTSHRHHHQKPPLKKSYGLNYSQQGNNGGVRISPVLNVAPPTIFGFGSFFITKDKSKKKW